MFCHNDYGDSDLEELGNGKPIDSGAIEEAVRKIDERLWTKTTCRECRNLTRECGEIKLRKFSLLHLTFK
ncbi:hypothetical protein UF75_0344 [Desulfosporosinus sp. I2]|nr:hypothetical protein UF75_0344 [Desulfosporosinus sp. I2]